MKHLIFKLLTANLFCFSVFANNANPPKVNLEFFRDVKNIVSEGYVGEINDEEFFYNALNGAISGLDPHSAYINPKDYASFKEGIEGEFSGIGVQIAPENGFIKVISPIDDTPAFKAGIKGGDFITHINGENTYQMSLEEASSKMRGKEGTKLKLVIIRMGNSEPIEIELKREKIKNKSVSVKTFDGIAIVRISSFTPQTAKELRAELKKLPNIEGVILDLRSNPGGVLEQSIIISNLFLKENSKIVSVKGRRKEFYRALPQNGKALSDIACEVKEKCEKIIINQTDGETFFIATNEQIVKEETPVIVLINKSSASASEIVAAAIKENKRGVVVGEVSFGKGVVQTILPIYNGEKGALKLTTARYYTPEGNAIQTAGVTPNIIVTQGKLEPFESKVQTLFSQREGDLKNHTVGEKLEEIAKQSSKYQQSKEEIKFYFQDVQMFTAINIINSIKLVK